MPALPAEAHFSEQSSPSSRRRNPRPGRPTLRQRSSGLNARLGRVLDVAASMPRTARPATRSECGSGEGRAAIGSTSPRQCPSGANSSHVVLQCADGASRWGRRPRAAGRRIPRLGRPSPSDAAQTAPLRPGDIAAQGAPDPRAGSGPPDRSRGWPFARAGRSVDRPPAGVSAAARRDVGNDRRALPDPCEFASIFVVTHVSSRLPRSTTSIARCSPDWLAPRRPDLRCDIRPRLRRPGSRERRASVDDRGPGTIPDGEAATGSRAVDRVRPMSAAARWRRATTRSARRRRGSRRSTSVRGRRLADDQAGELAERVRFELRGWPRPPPG